LNTASMPLRGSYTRTALCPKVLYRAFPGEQVNKLTRVLSEKLNWVWAFKELALSTINKQSNAKRRKYMYAKVVGEW
jgi:hypothetical protein